MKAGEEEAADMEAAVMTGAADMAAADMTRVADMATDARLLMNSSHIRSFYHQNIEATADAEAVRSSGLESACRRR